MFNLFAQIAVSSGNVKTIILALTCLVGLFIIYKLLGIRVISNSQLGIVERWWSVKGSLSEGEIIALNGEAGYLPDVLRGGVHIKPGIFFKVYKYDLITVPQGKIAYAFSRSGKSLDSEGIQQTLGKVTDCANYQNVEAFLKNGGQKGPQRAILREGTYAINVCQFAIIMEDNVHFHDIGTSDKNVFETMRSKIAEVDGFNPLVIKGKDDFIGIVTTHEGLALDKDQVIAPVVGDNPSADNYHDNYQNIEAFLKAGGRKGRQYGVLIDGTYFINRLFATVELVKKTEIPVGFVGVVVSYIGEKGIDVSGDDYKHGELVEVGYKGVCKDALQSGKYAFNPYGGRIYLVPTTNIILKWITSETGSLNYDENLKEVNLITKDAFEPALPLSVVVHIDYRKAPYVIQRFGDVQQLVNQTLDPMVSAYFKNIGQTKTLIELLQERSDIQEKAKADMRNKFNLFNLELEEVLIGTPTSSSNDKKIEEILEQLRDRQVAVEQVKTYESQQKAADQQKVFNEAKAKAEKQAELTNSSIEIQIQQNKSIAEVKKAEQDKEKQRIMAEADKIKRMLDAEAEANSVKIKAQADAEATVTRGNADAEKEKAVGLAKALAIEAQVNAYGGPQYQLINDIMPEVTKAIKEIQVPIVPQTVIGSSEDNNVLGKLATMFLTNKLGFTSTDKSKS